MTDTAPIDDLDVITARFYGERGYPHDEWTRLRAEAPVHRFQPEGYRILSVSRGVFGAVGGAFVRLAVAASRSVGVGSGSGLTEELAVGM